MADEKNNKSVTESVLGDMFGLSVDKQPAPELPKDQLVLEVLEDRTRLMVQGILYLLLAFAALALTFFLLGLRQCKRQYFGSCWCYCRTHHYVVCITSHGKTF